MSLNFDFKRIKDWDAVVSDPLDNDKLSPVTDRLIWLCMTVDIGEITAANVDEFYWRMRFIQRLDGPNIQFNDGTEVYLTKQDIIDHVGLSTNVITLKRTAWATKKLLNEQHPTLRQEESARAIYARIALANARKNENERQADAQDE
jgi:hypothetical protein